MTKKKIIRKGTQSRKVFTSTEVGVLIEDLNKKMDLMIEGFSAQTNRIGEIEELVHQMGQKIIIIEDKLMLIGEKQLQSEELIRQIEKTQLQSESNMRLIEDKLVRLESVVAALADTASKNVLDIQTLQSRSTN